MQRTDGQMQKMQGVPLARKGDLGRREPKPIVGKAGFSTVIGRKSLNGNPRRTTMWRLVGMESCVARESFMLLLKVSLNLRAWQC